MNHPDQTRPATLSGAEAAVEMLKAHGVEILFGLCGDTSLPFYDALAAELGVGRMMEFETFHAVLEAVCEDAV